jgi:excisionase family DNA binding protein
MGATAVGNKSEKPAPAACEIKKHEKSVADKMRDGDLLTLEEAADTLGVKDHWGVRYLINHHKLPVHRIGRNLRLDPEDIREWKLKHREIVTF